MRAADLIGLAASSSRSRSSCRLPVRLDGRAGVRAPPRQPPHALELDGRRARGRARLPAGRLPLGGHARPGGDDGRRRLLARLRRRRLARPLRRELVRRARGQPLEGRGRPAARPRSSATSKETFTDVSAGFRRRPRRPRERVRRRRPRPRRPHGPLRHDRAAERPALERRRRHASRRAPPTPASTPTAGGPEQPSGT